MSPINGRFRESARPFGKGLGLLAGQPCQFALQPIVEPSEGKNQFSKRLYAETTAAARSISSVVSIVN